MSLLGRSGFFAANCTCDCGGAIAVVDVGVRSVVAASTAAVGALAIHPVVIVGIHFAGHGFGSTAHRTILVVAGGLGAVAIKDRIGIYHEIRGSVVMGSGAAINADALAILPLVLMGSTNIASSIFIGAEAIFKCMGIGINLGLISFIIVYYRTGLASVSIISPLHTGGLSGKGRLIRICTCNFRHIMLGTCTATIFARILIPHAFRIILSQAGREETRTITTVYARIALAHSMRMVMHIHHGHHGHDQRQNQRPSKKLLHYFVSFFVNLHQKL